MFMNVALVLQISVADLPGLVEGAHINIGMGHKFLKHVVRTKLLAFVVDLQGFRLSIKHELRSAFENVVLLNKVSSLKHCLVCCITFNVCCLCRDDHVCFGYRWCRITSTFTALIHSIIQRLIISYSKYFNKNVALLLLN